VDKFLVKKIFFFQEISNFFLSINSKGKIKTHQLQFLFEEEFENPENLENFEKSSHLFFYSLN